MLNIIHTSDIFIQHKRLKEYNEIFHIFFEKIRIIKPDFIIFCGNLLNDRSVSDIKDLQILNEILYTSSIICTTLLIAGDHDKFDTDDILSSINIPNVYYLKSMMNIKCREYNINFHANISKIHHRENEINILLFNGEIMHSLDLFNEEILLSKYQIYMFDDYNFVFCGGNKKMQTLNDHIAYCGQLIQQNILEPRNKYGFLHWAITNHKDYRVYFKEIVNEYGYLRYNLSIKDGIVSYTDYSPKFPNYWDVKIENCIQYKNIDDVLKYTNISTFLREKIALYGKPNQIIYKTLEHNEPTKISYTDIIKKLTGNEELCKLHLKYYGNSNTTYSRIKLKLLTLQFSNIYCFGENCSINFQPFDNIVSGIIAGNEMGKSSIINIILIALFGDSVINEKPRDIIRIGSPKGHIILRFASPKYIYEITRNFWKTGKTQCIFKKNDIILGEDMIKFVVGEPECVLNTSIIKQIVDYDIISVTANERKNIFAKSLRIAEFGDIEKIVKKDIKTHCITLKKLQTNINLETHNVELQKLRKDYENINIQIVEIEKLIKYNTYDTHLNKKSRITELKTKLTDINKCLISFPPITGIECVLTYDLETLFNIKSQLDSIQIDTINSELSQFQTEYDEKMEILHNISDDNNKLTTNRELIKKSHIFTFLTKYAHNDNCTCCVKLVELKNMLSGILKTELKTTISQLERENAYLIIGNLKNLLKNDCDSLFLKIKKRKSAIAFYNSYNITDINNQLYTYKIKLEYEQNIYNEELTLLDVGNFTFYTEKYENLILKRNEIQNSITQYENEIITHNKNSIEIVQIESEIKLLKDYLNVIKPSGIPSYLIGLQIEKINKIINSILYSCDKNFTGGIKIMATDMYKIYYSSDMVNYHLASLTSGYRRFVINLSLKMALWQITNAPIFDCLIIDEKISACDTAKLKNMMEFIENIAYNENLPSLVFLVSHLDYVKAKMQKFLTISKTNDGNIVKNDISEIHIENEQLEGKYYCEYCDIYISNTYKEKHLLSKKHKLNIT